MLTPVLLTAALMTPGSAASVFESEAKNHRAEWLLALAQPAGVDLSREFENALGAAGLQRGTARFDMDLVAFFNMPRHRTTFFDAAFRDPWRLPTLARVHRNQMEAGSGRPSRLIGVASRMIGAGSRRELLGEPGASFTEYARTPNSLSRTLARMRQQDLIVDDTPALDGVPEEVQQAAAAILEASLALVEYRRTAFSQVTDLNMARALASRHWGPTADIQDEQSLLALYDAVQMEYLYAAAQDMAAVIEAAEGWLGAVSATRAYDWRLQTRWGQIRLTGGTDHVHEGETLLIIDTGGNDRYLNVPSNASAANWLSVVIDTQGNDEYLSDLRLSDTSIAEFEERGNGRTESGPASALFGMSFLVDRRGDDLYRTHRPGLGSARFGVAVLMDREGNDTYDAYAESQGFGKFGIGILHDLSGDDEYAGFMHVQGVGLPGGMGLLYDLSGDDVYIANDSELDFPSAQTAEHNINMSQGAGYGYRMDYLTGNSISGGIGVLFDAEGNDTYSGGVFVQGVGYWEGIGMLWDGSGNDEFLGQWYAQGSAAHFAVGYLESGGGDDLFQAPINMAMGAGHDFSLGMLVNRSGNDRYEAGNLSLGAGNANGIGIFVDVEGNDYYQGSNLTLGQAAASPAGTLREIALALGLFIDLQGQDRYPEAATWAQNARRSTNWAQERTVRSESQVGIFIDR